LLSQFSRSSQLIDTFSCVGWLVIELCSFDCDDSQITFLVDADKACPFHPDLLTLTALSSPCGVIVIDLTDVQTSFPTEAVEYGRANDIDSANKSIKKDRFSLM
jgi:hypothetical protein